MSKHTPGPWHATVPPSSDIHFIRNIDSDDAGQIAKVRVGPVLEQAEALANARLIAAAPDLLEALECLQEWVDNCFQEYSDAEVCSVARAAIAKAEGRGTP